MMALLAGVALVAAATSDTPFRARVVSNLRYRSLPERVDAAASADLVASALEQAGFRVERCYNLERGYTCGAEWVTLVYYVGHAVGFQPSGGAVQLHLLPTDVSPMHDVFQGDSLMWDDLSQDLEAGVGRWTQDGVDHNAAITVVDACTQHLINPAWGADQRRWFRDHYLDLSLVAHPSRTALVLASTRGCAPMVAGEPSPMARAFSEQITQSGRTVEQLFRRVAAEVQLTTQGAQRPAYSLGRLGDEVLVVATPPTPARLGLAGYVALVLSPEQDPLLEELGGVLTSRYGFQAVEHLQGPQIRQEEVEARLAAMTTGDGPWGVVLVWRGPGRCAAGELIWQTNRAEGVAVSALVARLAPHRVWVLSEGCHPTDWDTRYALPPPAPMDVVTARLALSTPGAWLWTSESFPGAWEQLVAQLREATGPLVYASGVHARLRRALDQPGSDATPPSQVLLRGEPNGNFVLITTGDAPR